MRIPGSNMPTLKPPPPAANPSGLPSGRVSDKPPQIGPLPFEGHPRPLNPMNLGHRPSNIMAAGPGTQFPSRPTWPDRPASPSGFSAYSIPSNVQLPSRLGSKVPTSSTSNSPQSGHSTPLLPSRPSSFAPSSPASSRPPSDPFDLESAIARPSPASSRPPSDPFVFDSPGVLNARPSPAQLQSQGQAHLLQSRRDAINQGVMPRPPLNENGHLSSVNMNVPTIPPSPILGIQRPSAPPQGFVLDRPNKNGLPPTRLDYARRLEDQPPVLGPNPSPFTPNTNPNGAFEGGGAGPLNNPATTPAPNKISSFDFGSPGPSAPPSPTGFSG